MSDEQQQYGVRRVIPFEAAAESLEIEIRRALRQVFEAVKDNDERPDWQSFELCVQPASKAWPAAPFPLTLDARIYVKGTK